MLLGNSVVTAAEDVADRPLHGFHLALYPLISLCLSLYQLLLLFSFNILLAATFPLRLHDFFILLHASQVCLLHLSPTSLLLTYLSSSFWHVFAPSDSTQPGGCGVGGHAGWLRTCVAEAHLSPAVPPRLQATHYSHPLFFFEFFTSHSTAFMSAILFFQEKREFDHNK